MTGNDEPHSLSAVVERLGRAGEGPKVTVSEIVDTIGQGAFAPLLLAPALVIVSPASGIPGLSSLGGLIIALIALHIVIGRETLWLPGFISRRRISREALRATTRFLIPPARFIDRFTYRRLAFLTDKPFALVPASICLLAGLVIPLFEFVPFSSSIIAAAVSLFALALVTRDGVLVLVGLTVVGGTGYLGWNVAA